jgi:ketosteroid isomerase-like protein
MSIVEGDVETYTACFAEDGVIMHPDSPQVRGQRAITDYASGMFGTVSVPLLDLTPVSVMGEGKYAFEVGIQQCEVEPALPGFKRERQHLHVYERGDDGAWYIAAAMSGNQ